MATEPRGNDALSSWAIPSRTARFEGEPQDVTGARLATEEFLHELAGTVPPTAPECWHDIVLIVTELAANAVQYAPGPFELCLRPTFDGVHVTLHDTNSTPPSPGRSIPTAGAVVSAGTWCTPCAVRSAWCRTRPARTRGRTCTSSCRGESGGKAGTERRERQRSRPSCQAGRSAVRTGTNTLIVLPPPFCFSMAMSRASRTTSGQP